MNRLVERIRGKLFLGQQLVPYYYVQFAGSENFEYVRCSDVMVNHRQNREFDMQFSAATELTKRSSVGEPSMAGLDKAKDINASRFYEDPTTGGASEDEQEMVKGFYEEQARNRIRGRDPYSKARRVLNFVNDECVEVRLGLNGSESESYLLKSFKQEFPESARKSVVFSEDEDDKYDTSFIQDSTPSVRSTPGTLMKLEKQLDRKIKKTKKRHRRVIIDETDEESNGPTPPRAKSSRIPLIILGADGREVKKPRPGSSTGQIPVVTLD